MNKFSILFLGLGLSACAGGYNPSYYYNQIQVANLSGAAISELSVSVANSRDLSCAAVANNAICDERFGKRRYPQQAVDLTWTHGDGSQKSQRLEPHIAAYFYSGLPLQLLLEIDADGDVKPHFEQEERGDRRFIN